jgi:peroxiredoxin
MRSKFMLLILLLLTYTLYAQPKSSLIQGKLGLSRSKTIFLLYTDPVTGVAHKDSALVNKGSFAFESTIEIPSKAILYSSPDYNRVDLYLEPGTIEVKSQDSLSHAIVSGSVVNRDFNVLRKRIATVEAKGKKINNEARARMTASPELKEDQEFRKEWDNKISEVGAELKLVYKSFIEEMPGNMVTIEAIEFIVGPNPDITTVKKLFSSINENVRNSSMGKQYAKKIDDLEKVNVGSVAPEFTQADTSGNLVSLKDFKGKYLLIDFWASWCGPCREESPNLVKAFHTYKNSNFSIVSISLDKASARKAWLKAIIKDGLLWTQLSDLKGWDNEAAKLYSVSSVPKSFLISPEGKIVAKDLRGEALNKKLEELLSKKN